MSDYLSLLEKYNKLNSEYDELFVYRHEMRVDFERERDKLRSEIARRDKIITRLKEDAIILALMLTLNGKFKESELRNFHSVINNHIALMKEVE